MDQVAVGMEVYDKGLDLRRDFALGLEPDKGACPWQAREPTP